MCRKTFAVGAAVGASVVSRGTQATLPLLDSTRLLPSVSPLDAPAERVESAELGSGGSWVTPASESQRQIRSTRQFMLTMVFR